MDVTAEETGDLLRVALGQGFDLVLANKKPLAGSAESYVRLLEAAARGRAARPLRGHGGRGPAHPRHLPQAAWRAATASCKIEGAVSGTLGFVLSAVSAGRPFSEAVREAMDRGYTEPDPRDDLSGRDVARKGLILARLLGYAGGSLVAEDLTPRPLRRLPLAAFLKRLPEFDDGWRARVGARGREGPGPALRRHRHARGVRARPRRGPARLRPWARSRGRATSSPSPRRATGKSLS